MGCVTITSLFIAADASFFEVRPPLLFEPNLLYLYTTLSIIYVLIIIWKNNQIGTDNSLPALTRFPGIQLLITANCVLKVLLTWFISSDLESKKTVPLNQTKPSLVLYLWYIKLFLAIKRQGPDRVEWWALIRLNFALTVRKRKPIDVAQQFFTCCVVIVLFFRK